MHINLDTCFISAPSSDTTPTIFVSIFPYSPIFLASMFCIFPIVITTFPYTKALQEIQVFCFYKWDFIYPNDYNSMACLLSFYRICRHSPMVLSHLKFFFLQCYLMLSNRLFRSYKRLIFCISRL